MDGTMDQRDAIGGVLVGSLGAAYVLLQALEPGVTFDLDLGWLLGGFVLGSALVAFEQFTATGSRLRGLLDRSVAVRFGTVVVGLVLLVGLFLLGGLQYDPAWLSGLLGLSASWPLVALLYFWQ